MPWSVLLACHIMAGLAAGFFEQSDGFDNQAAVDRLDHVVQGQGSNGSRGHGLHLDTGLAGQLNQRFDGEAIRSLWCEVDADFFQCQAGGRGGSGRAFSWPAMIPAIRAVARTSPLGN